MSSIPNQRMRIGAHSQRIPMQYALGPSEWIASSVQDKGGIWIGLRRGSAKNSGETGIGSCVSAINRSPNVVLASHP
jgi:hypothetical protein